MKNTAVNDKSIAILSIRTRRTQIQFSDLFFYYILQLLFNVFTEPGICFFIKGAFCDCIGELDVLGAPHEGTKDELRGNLLALV